MSECSNACDASLVVTCRSFSASATAAQSTAISPMGVANASTDCKASPRIGTRCVGPNSTTRLGYPPEELIGQCSHALIHHSRAGGAPYPVEECPMFAAYTQGKASRIDDECLWRKDGHGLPV